VQAYRSSQRADREAQNALAASRLAETRAAEAQAQSRRADGEAARALESAEAARAAAEESARQEALARATLEDLLSLSAIQDLKDLEERADALWPLDPEKVPALDAWLSDARSLMEGQAADAERGVEKRLSLAEHEEKLAQIRASARPRTPEQIDGDRRASPFYSEWQAARGELEWRRRMLRELPWPTEAEVESALAAETLPTDTKGLNRLAWPLVECQRTESGGEMRALILARRALALATPAERADIRTTLAWALYRCGRVEEARREVENVKASEPEISEDLVETLDHLEVAHHLPEWIGDEARAQQSENTKKLAGRVSRLEARVEESRTFEFDDGRARWWHAQLSKLVSDLRAFTDEESGGLYSSGTSPTHGWGIVKRAEFARTIEERSVTGADARRRWDEAIAAITASPKYDGLVMTPQLGLLPIGADPASGLWEFAHLQTGDPAIRGDDGRLSITEATGLVFVLIPAGTFWMGAQSTDASQPNFDPQARNNESPVHQVTLSSYLLSKYEMTQGQWLRLTGRNPSAYGPSSVLNGRQHDLTHPVEQVTWTGCMELMARLGLDLPSEAQWEYGCRAGSDTPWWTGADRESLRGNVNLADQTAKRAGATWGDINDWPDLEDGWVIHAPVGSFPANAFGLHEVHGNVWEWCLDGYANYLTTAQTNPVGPWAGAQSRVYRGGGSSNAASLARSAYRNNNTPEARNGGLGLRPARASRLSASQLHPPGK
jgi:formylglycine-generating enzyme required for sulfatase activity